MEDAKSTVPHAQPNNTLARHATVGQSQPKATGTNGHNSELERNLTIDPEYQNDLSSGAIPLESVAPRRTIAQLRSNRSAHRAFEQDSDMLSHVRTEFLHKPVHALAAPIPEISHGEPKVSFARLLLVQAETWGVSFFIHLTAILLLAFLTFSVLPDQGVDISATLVSEEAFDHLDMLTTFQLTEFQEANWLENSLTQESSEQVALEFADQADLPAFDSGEFAASLASASGMMDTIAGAGFVDPNMEIVGNSATFCGIQVQGKKFVYVVDKSGSMMGDPWDQAVAELFRSITGLTDEQEFFIVLFNHTANPMLGLSGASMALHPANNANVSAARFWVFQQFPVGGTLPRDSMMMAMQMNPDAIFFLSDGVFNDGTLEYLRRNNSARRVSQGKKRIAIHTIAFKDFSGAHMLKQIAEENEGTFTFVH
ncbi:MAG TPA: hypothetical protein PKD64_12385 [Pirellulaceae bacterium]|nr:hypothetical protein [Pirellulaceae bacterium]HMO92985.1 hypothetical protein [Pirellulaceae bacterium]HMP67936.1 hypothetical protein [Pirellulaceae bacterium]